MRDLTCPRCDEVFQVETGERPSCPSCEFAGSVTETPSIDLDAYREKREESKEEEAEDEEPSTEDTESAVAETESTDEPESESAWRLVDDESRTDQPEDVDKTGPTETRPPTTGSPGTEEEGPDEPKTWGRPQQETRDADPHQPQSEGRPATEETDAPVDDEELTNEEIVDNIAKRYAKGEISRETYLALLSEFGEGAETESRRQAVNQHPTRGEAYQGEPQHQTARPGETMRRDRQVERQPPPEPRAQQTRPQQAEESKGSIGAAIFWMALLSVLLFWLPVFGPLIAGYVGGKKAGSAGRGAIAALLPGFIVAGIIFFVLADLPVLGAIVAMGTMIIIGVWIFPVFVGALIGGAVA